MLATATHDRQIWSGMLMHLRTNAPELCRQWFEEIEPVGVAGGVLRLRAHSNIHRDYLQRQCNEPFNDAARTVSQMLITVQFLGPDDQVSAAPSTLTTFDPPASERIDRPSGGVNGRTPTTGRNGPVERAARVAAEQAARSTAEAAHSAVEPRAVGAGLNGTPRPSLPLALNPDYTFEHFVVGPSNRLAHAAAMAVSANPGRAYNPYFVHGSVGLGKTHLLQAVCLKILQTNPTARIYYTSCEGFITQFMEAVQAGEMSAFRHTFRDVDVLVIDDVHFLAKRDRTQEEFFHTFNSLYQAQKQIILSSDAPPEEIPDLEERLVSRFKWGLVSHVGPPCYETRVAILKNKARMRGFELPDDAACHIAARIDSNIRELEGAIVKVQVMASVEKRPIDLEMAISALGPDPGAVSAGRQVQIQTIIDVVTAYFGVKVTDLQSKRRHRSVAIPRQVCMFLCRRYTRYSLEEIGGYFGGRDHTTVMHAVKTIDARMETDQEFARTVRLLDEQVRIPSIT
ncbi:MAG: chromosomal replication initiator protein DnaA [Phycisphaeraceae bacterium]|nr:chromosomal replication initiator protein DnaA [Phycisphaeraceae bacterium]